MTRPQNSEAVTATAEAPAKPKARHEWFQTATHVTLELFVKGRRKDQVPLSPITLHHDHSSLIAVLLKVSVKIEARTLDLTVMLDDGAEYHLDLDLADEVDPAQSKYEVLGTKVEIKMKKARSAKWETLEAPADASAKVIKAWDSVEDPKASKGLAYPSSAKSAAKTGRDWDKLAKESGALEEDKLEGDAALNQVFSVPLHLDSTLCLPR